MNHSLVVVLGLWIISVANVSPLEGKIFLVFGGKTGWIGQQLIQHIKDQGHVAIAAESRLEDRPAIKEEIDKIHPDFIVNAAGVTGPNICWCEDHQQETIRTNVIGALNLADIAFLSNILMINIATGCIYEYDEQHPMYSGKGFTEQDKPNFKGSFYSKTKVVVETLLRSYPNVLQLRLRMPISANLDHPRNLIRKISKYEKVINIPNSMTILEDLLPLIPQMATRGLTGIYNFTNPGVITHNQILDLYKEYIDSQFTYKNFTVEEQNQILKAPRSNNELDTSKLLKEFPNIPTIQESILAIFKKMHARKLKNS